jgi:hypothetical protein
MRDMIVLSFCALALGAGAGAAQEGEGALTERLDREDRIVMYSPHFDEPVPHWGGLSCEAGPLHLYGFEGEGIDAESRLRVRAFLYDPTLTREYVFPAEGSSKRALEPAEMMVRLTRRLDGDLEEDLPLDTTWVQMADETGLAVFTVPEGVYGIRFEHLGVRRDEGVVRVRGVRADSLHAYLIPGAICEQ